MTREPAPDFSQLVVTMANQRGWTLPNGQRDPRVGVEQPRHSAGPKLKLAMFKTA